MAIDTSGMTSLLARLDAARAAMAQMPSAAASPGKVGAGGGVDFGALLKANIGKVDSAQTASMGLAERFQLGDPKVTLEDTMVSLSKANIEFQQMVQVRNRVVQAYHDIMNLQI